MRRILLIFVAIAVFTPWARAADPKFGDDLTAIITSDYLRAFRTLHPTELRNNPPALAARARALEDAANRVAKRLDIDVAHLLRMPLEQQIVETSDSTDALMLALALGHAGQDEATRAGLRLWLSRDDPHNYLLQTIPVLLLAPASGEKLWTTAIPMLHEGSSDALGVFFFSHFFPPTEHSIQSISNELQPELVDPLSLVLLAIAIESPKESSPDGPPEPADDAPRSIPEPILLRIQNNWREVPPFAAWIATRTDMPRETTDEALRRFLQWPFAFHAGENSIEEGFASIFLIILLSKDHTREVIENAVISGKCSESMARVVMEQLEAEKATKIWMEQNPELVPVRGGHDG